MTAAEMQAIAPAPEGCEWVYEDGAVVLSSGRHRAYIELDRRWFHLRLQAGSPAPWTSICTCAPGGIDALLALRRLAGHIWPWPGWPVVEGVRPAGWGPRPTADERTAHRATGGSWLWRRGDNPVWQVVDPDTVGTGQFCAIDRDGRWVDVDTRGQG